MAARYFDVKNAFKSQNNSNGAVMLTVIFVIIIIGLVGAAIYSLTFTSTYTQLNAQNATRARYIAESGVRIVAAEYNSTDAPNKNTTLESLHNETLTLPDNNGQVDLRIYPYWFYANAAYSAGGGSIVLKMPGGIPLTDIEDAGSALVTIPGSGRLKLQGKTRRAIITASSVSGNTITLTLASPGFPYDIQPDEELFLVYTDSATLPQTVAAQDASLVLPAANSVLQFIPAENGSFRVHNEENDRMDYTYREKIKSGAYFYLDGIRSQDPDDPSVFPFSVGKTSEIYFGKNLVVAATTSLGQGRFSGQKTVVSYSDVGLDGGFSIGRETISLEEDIEDFNYTLPTNNPEPASGKLPITVDVTSKEINLGGGLTDGYGAVWYGGDADTANCIEGRCNLGRGFRSYFEFVSNSLDSSDGSTTYGDGFTFAIVSGVWDGAAYRNTKYDTGSGGEYLGYAGPGLSGDGLESPKIALEFDTYPNPGAGSICSSNSRRDDTNAVDYPDGANHVAMDYWGTGDSSAQPGSFDADGGYLRVGSSSPGNGDPEDWSSTSGTISFWFKRDTIDYGNGASSGDRMWGQSANMEMRFSGYSGYDFVLDWGGTNSITAANSSYSDGSYNHPFHEAGKWYFMAITWNETSKILRVYYGDESTPPEIFANNNSWSQSVSSIGIIENLFMNSSGGNNSRNFAVDGQGTDLRYYDTDREPGQIQDDYNSRLTGSETNLVAYYPLESDVANAAASDPLAVPVGDTGWSAEAPSVFPTCSAVATRDDNRHGAGGGPTQPMNSLNTDSVSGADGYHQVAKGTDLYNWMEDGQLYGVRLELIRPKLDNGDGQTYDYQLKAWVERLDNLNATEKSNFKDTGATYADTAPLIYRTLKDGNPLELDQSVHDDLKQILFGFTEGTGGATQDITIRNLEMRFIKTYPVADLSDW